MVKEKEVLEKKIETVESEMVGMEEEIKKAKHKIEQIEKEKEIIKNEREDTQREKNIVEKNMKEMVQEKKNLENRMEDLQRDNETVKKEMEKMKKEKEVTEKEIEKMKREKEVTEKEIEKMKREKEVTEKEMEKMKREKEVIEKEIEKMKREKEVTEKEMEKMKREKEVTEKEMEKMKREKEVTDKEMEKMKREKEAFETKIQEIKKDKEAAEKGIEQMKREKETFETKIQEIKKDKEAAEKEIEQMKQVVDRLREDIKIEATQKVDLEQKFTSFNKELMNNDVHIKEMSNHIAKLMEENDAYIEEIEKLKQGKDNWENENQLLNIRMKKLEDELNTKQEELNENISIVNELQRKLNETDCHKMLLIDEVCSLRSAEKKLAEQLDQKETEMAERDEMLYKELMEQLVDNKIRARDDLSFDGHPYSVLLKILWFGFIDMCKYFLKTRDGNLYGGNKNYRFVSVHNTDMFLDAQMDDGKIGTLAFKNETRGIFLIKNKEDAKEDGEKNIIYVGPFSKFIGYNVCLAKNGNYLKLAEKHESSYIFEEVCESKKGTKLVFVKEKQTGKYFSVIKNKNSYDNQKKGVDKTEYRNMVSQLINYIKNKKEKENIIIKTSEKTLKIEKEMKHCTLVKKGKMDNIDLREKTEFYNLNGNESEKQTTTVKKEQNYNSKKGKKDKKKKDKITKLRPFEGNFPSDEMERKLNNKGSNELNNTLENELNNELNKEDTAEAYRIAKDMLLISTSNNNSNSSYIQKKSDSIVCGNKSDDAEKYSLNSKTNLKQNGPYTHKIVNKSIATNYIHGPFKMSNQRTSLFNVINITNTKVYLTKHKKKAILFEIFTFEQIVEQDAIRSASECVLNILLNFQKHKTLQNMYTHAKLNTGTTFDDEWCILPAYI